MKNKNWAHIRQLADIGSSPAPATLESQCFTLTFFMPVNL